MFTKKIVIEYREIDNVYEPLAVKARGIDLRDTYNICKRFLGQAEPALKAETKATIKDIKEAKYLPKTTKNILIKRLTGTTVPSYKIQDEIERRKAGKK